MAQVTANARSVVKAGKGTITTHAAVAKPVQGYSLHDCATPEQAGLHNCIWPLNFASSDGVTFKYGLVVHTREPGGTVSVTYT